jgi:uncharacterized SAM-binding protein YcdF (DUF218 family)
MERETTNKLNRKDTYEKMLGGFSPDAIIVLSGGVTQKGDGTYRSTAYKDDGFGGKARVIAAAELAAAFPDSVIVTTSKVGDENHAQIMKAELERLSIPEDRILTEERSTNTRTELEEMARMTVDYNWGNVVVITNDWHMPRTKEFFERLGSLPRTDEETVTALQAMKDANIQVSFVEAEDILPIRSSKYQPLIDAAKSTEDHLERVAAEERGIRALREGTYGK